MASYFYSIADTNLFDNNHFECLNEAGNCCYSRANVKQADYICFVIIFIHNSNIFELCILKRRECEQLLYISFINNRVGIQIIILVTHSLRNVCKIEHNEWDRHIIEAKSNNNSSCVCIFNSNIPFLLVNFNASNGLLSLKILNDSSFTKKSFDILLREQFLDKFESEWCFKVGQYEFCQFLRELFEGYLCLEFDGLHSTLRSCGRKFPNEKTWTLNQEAVDIDLNYLGFLRNNIEVVFVILIGAVVIFIAIIQFYNSRIKHVSRKNFIRVIFATSIKTSLALKIKMENKNLLQKVSGCRSKRNTRGNILGSAIDDNVANFTPQSSSRMGELGEAKLLRQNSLPQSCHEEAIIDDLLHIEKQQQVYWSSTSLLTSLPCSPSKTFSTVKKRLSSFDRCRSQSPRKSQPKQHTGCDENTSIYDSSSPVIGSTINLMLNNARVKDCCINDDKENESPKATEIMNSPKMKVTDHALAEQNSPVPYDFTKAHFSYSPKQIHTEELTTNSPNWPLVNTISDTVSCYSSASPLLNSAVYKHGNYFKFPEVDSLSCEQTADEILLPRQRISTLAASNTSDTVNSTTIQKNTLESQASRRVRLKSISLDSDGARLVEDNLGIPVEELVQCANETSCANSQLNATHEEVENCVYKDRNKRVFGVNKNNDHPTAHDTMKVCVPHASSTTTKINRKNKNNLKINIDTRNNFISPSSSNSNEMTAIVKVQTPKTPTLTQSKQKAFSLDSSDSNNLSSYSMVSSAKKTQIQQSSTNLKTIHQLSSISVPTTPKRHTNVTRKKSCGKLTTLLKPSNSIKVPTYQLTPLNSVLNPLDYKQHMCSGGGLDEEQSLQIAIDIDDNYGDEIDEGNMENFYMEEIDNEVLVVNGDDSKMNYHEQIEPRKRNKMKIMETDGHLLGTNLQMQKFGMLSLSNNNLETLPEVMTLADFGDCACDDTLTLQDSCPEPQTELTINPVDEIRYGTAKIGTFSRANLLQRRGSNQSLTINLNMNGSLGNLTKCMSASNYSLGSFTGSNYNLNSCPQHQLNMCPHVQSNASSTQSITTHGYCSSQMNILHPNSTSPLQQQNSFEVDLTQPAGTSNKKNILQRRGSNTSLTLNIKGSSSVNLNRFNSHSSLNISSMHTTINASSSFGKFKQHSQHVYNHFQQPQQYNQQHQSQFFRQQSVNKKGLLERRNSNASLTLNIHNSGLTGSSYNLRASVCSLNNITNASGDSFEQPILPTNLNSNFEHRGNAELVTNMDQRHQRKFLSSENLNAMATQCNKLNQTHVRNSIKTCFGSVSDLKPSTANSNEYHMKHDIDADQFLNINTNRQFEQSNLCSCTGVRNITTKPLSPQSTSEDFKMYLANVQLLQNATNILTEEHMRKLHYIFEENYESQKIPAHKNKNRMSHSELSSDKSSTDLQTKSHHSIQAVGSKSNHFDFDALPSDDERKHLLRSLHEEFWDLPTNHQEKPLVFGSQSKNRYKTILPNEHSRVILKTEYGNIQEPYINANYIKGPDYVKNSYIVTQGPLPNTIYDFWLMIQQNMDKYQRKQNQSENQSSIGLSLCKLSTDHKQTAVGNPEKANYPQKIVMLTNFIENNQQKCSIYFPVEINQVIFITNSNERFENSCLAAFYESYLNSPLNETDLLQGCGLEIEVDNGQINHDQCTNHHIEVEEMIKKNFFLIKNCGLREMEGYSIRKLTVMYVITVIKDHSRENVVNSRTNMAQILKKFTCYHYWFPDWPDHHSPEDVGLLLDMSLHLLDKCCDTEFQNHSNLKKSINTAGNKSVLEPILSMCGDVEPIPIIHCSAGIGRTGCLAAILNGIRQMRSSVLHALEPWTYQPMFHFNTVTKSTKNYVNVDVLGIVCNLRLQRGGMVQNSEQYELIHRALCLYQSRIDAELSPQGSNNSLFPKDSIIAQNDEHQSTV